LIVIYTKEISPRLSYTLNHVFYHQLGLSFEIVHDKTKLQNIALPIINYSDEMIENSLQIVPEDLLFQNTIEFWDMTFDANHQIGLLEHSENPKLSFDLLAAIFYLISRYEEYLFIENDEHNRFDVENSSLLKSECLNLPLVDIWIEDFKQCLIAHFSLDKSIFKTKKFEVFPTIDIDSLFAFKGKSIGRQFGGILKNLFQLQLSLLTKRLKVLFISHNDPFDNFDQQLSMWQTYQLRAQYFFHVGPYGKFDKNISNKNPYLKVVIDKIKTNGHDIGIHPSYQSNSDEIKIKSEIDTLHNLTQLPIQSSRQHYLRFTLPYTYRALISNGIQKEFSMGYASTTGFRAGTASNFYWYDLEKNESTNLEVLPFCMMDVAFKNGMELSIDESIDYSENIIKVLKDYQLPFRFIIHNESLSDLNGWKGWQRLFMTWLEKAK
jgi:hypothetical protein